MYSPKRFVYSGVFIGIIGFSAAGLVLTAGAAIPPAATLGSAQSPQLYQEYPQPGEDQQFAHFAQEIQDIQKTLAKGMPIERAFHSKAHGCLQGTFQVLASIPQDTQYGVLVPGAEYPVVGRFSNAAGHAQADTVRDMRGFAMKLSQVGADHTQVQDFLMTNGPVHFAKDAAGMMEFAQASTQGALAMAAYFAKNPKGALVLLQDTNRKVPSMTTQSYWSRTPFKIGPKAMKYNVQPCAAFVLSHSTFALSQAASNPSDSGSAVDPIWANSDLSTEMPSKPSATYLTDDLRARAAKGPICFELSIQMQKDPVAQPIEDASVEWKEQETPSIPVARIIFPAQSFDSTEQLQACNEMSFDPWNALPDFRPLGNMNRARRAVYPSSATLRGAKW